MTKQRVVAVERVSTRRQTPGIQSPELRARVKGQGYDLVRVFTLTASASKGRQQKVLDEVLAGARDGNWRVVLCVAIDRIERRGIEPLRDWLSDLHRAGARLESTSPGEEWLADDRNDLMWNIRLDVEADRARRESELRKERTKRGHDEVDRQKSGRVKLPLGYRYDRVAKYQNKIVADEAALTVVKAAFAMAARGETLQAIARDMTKRGYPRGPVSVGLLLRMRCYSTGQLYVPVAVPVTPAVTPEVQAQAIAQLEARRTYDGPRKRTTDATDFAGRIYCAEHLSPLYRQYGPRLKDGSRKRYYRPRSGGGRCGEFHADTVDDLVNELLSTDTEPETEMVVTGDVSARLAEIEAEINRLTRKRPGGWIDSLKALDAEQKRLETTGGGWERRETGRTLGMAWRSMSRPEQRRYLERQAEQGNWRVLVQRNGKQLRVIWRPFGFEDSAVDANVERYLGPVALRDASRHVSKSQIQG